MNYPYASTLLIALGLVGAACTDDTTSDTETGTDTSTGDGDGDPATMGDGDGDPTGDGDGDGDPTGDGDGDPTGDGDGDPTGDGDGDPTGDGDGDPTGDGDGDGDMTGDGDGDGDMTGDGDGDMTLDDTIYDCRNGMIAFDTPVDVDGVWVTAILANGFFAQEEPGGEESGIWVFVGDRGPDITGLEIGELVDIEGTLVEFNDIDEIDASLGTVAEVGALDPIPMPDIVTADLLVPEIGEVWESVYVRLEGVPLVVTELLGFEEFIVADGGVDGDPAIIDNYVYSLPIDGAMDFPSFGVAASFTAVQGVVNFSFDDYKIAPRGAADFEGYIEAPPPPFAGINDLEPGDLVITEIMYDPNVCNDTNCEWIEILNASGEDVNLQGLRIQDENLSLTGTVDVELVIPDGGYAWIGKGPADNWSYSNPADAYTGSNPGFNNSGDDQAVILNDNEILDSTGKYVSQGATDNGVSWKLDPDLLDAVSNDDPANWCFSTLDFGDGDLGTPKALNEAECNPNLPGG